MALEKRPRLSRTPSTFPACTTGHPPACRDGLVPPVYRRRFRILARDAGAVRRHYTGAALALPAAFLGGGNTGAGFILGSRSSRCARDGHRVLLRRCGAPGARPPVHTL